MAQPVRSRGTILVVEDECVLAANIREYLEHFHYGVQLARTRKEGLEKFAALRPQVVLLDIRLPDGDGGQVLHRIRQSDPTVGVIVMTAFGGIEPAVAAMAAGADDYIEKPFPLDSMLHLIEALIRRKRPPAASLH